MHVCTSYTYMCDSKFLPKPEQQVFAWKSCLFTPWCKWLRKHSAIGELFLLPIFCPGCLYNIQFICGNIYTPEKSCRVALKCEGTVASEVLGRKYVRTERKIHIWQVGKSEEENGQRKNICVAILSRQGHLSHEVLHQKWPRSQWASVQSPVSLRQNEAVQHKTKVDFFLKQHFWNEKFCSCGFHFFF